MVKLGKDALLLCFLLLSSLSATEYKPIVLDPSYNHDKWGTSEYDIKREFRAYTASFDSADDDDADEVPDAWGIPHFVCYEIKKLDEPLGDSPDRPSPWITDEELHELGLAPDDDTYHFSREWRENNPFSKFAVYDRGHLCMKHHAFRLGEAADWNTHTMINCVPQRSELNQGIWLDLENRCAEWADEYGSVWVITGPILYGLKPYERLGQRELGEMMVAIPDAFFKIIVREGQTSDSDPVVLAFIYPQRGRNYKKSGGYDHTPFLTNVRAIEHFTDLTFFNNFPEEVQVRIKKNTATELWP